ncbi:MAG: hypothetical protein IID17_13930 [Nitrospinae bacterium]|nr:hypothetical protein [Nitrospinota bacterium]
MNDPAASEHSESDNGYHLKAVASVTLDPKGKYFFCQQTLSRPSEF